MIDDFIERRKALQNRIAERALTRGRKMTPQEQLRNLEQGLGMKPGRLSKLPTPPAQEGE